MTTVKRTVDHATFVIEREYDAPPTRVFGAWSDAAAKARWFCGPGEWRRIDYKLDFRVGGYERLAGAHPGEDPHIYEARYQDIVPDERIVFAYDMYIGDTRISVSLATVTLTPSRRGTRLAFTEQAVFLDGFDGAPSRENGTGQLLDNLAIALQRSSAQAAL